MAAAESVLFPNRVERWRLATFDRKRANTATIKAATIKTSKWATVFAGSLENEQAALLENNPRQKQTYAQPLKGFE